MTGADRPPKMAYLVPPGDIGRLVVDPRGFWPVVVFYPDGSLGIEHRCKVIGDTEIICAPLLQLDSGGHRVVSQDPLTIEPSISCPDCELRGFIRDGKWVAA